MTWWTIYWNAFCLRVFFFLYQTEKLAKLLNKYWSVELFWFPFNSIIDRMLDVLPDMDDTELTISTAEFFSSHPLDSVCLALSSFCVNLLNRVNIHTQMLVCLCINW